MNKEKSLEQFKKNINLMFENNDKEIYLHKDDALKIEYYIYSLEQQCKKQEEVIDKIKECINDFPVIHYSSIEKVDNKRLSGKLIPIDDLLDILKEVSE